MHLEQIRTLFDSSAAIRLLRSDSAPFILDFLNLTFKKAGILTLGQEELKQKLLIYTEQLHETDPECLKGAMDRYLVNWSDSGWLNRHLKSSSNEPHYQLTRHSEDVIQFVDLLISQRTGLVGTESRLRLIIDTLSDLVQGSSSDPDKRLAYLEGQKKAILDEIEALQHGLPVEVYKPSQIRERFQMAVNLLKTLQSDFRAVEERFHEIALKVQQDQQKSLETRGQILGNAMDSEDLLKTEDEGISFYAFIAFLFTPESQQALRQTIDEVIRLEAVQDERDSIIRLKSMVKLLLNEADKVQSKNAHLSTSLRKLLNVEAAENRRQVSEVLLEIKQLAVSLRDKTIPDFTCGAVVQTSLDLFSPFTRTFWTTPQTFVSQPEEHVIDLERTARERTSLANLEYLDLEQLRQNVQMMLQSEEHLTLENIIVAIPPASGVLELVGYFQIAFEDGHIINRENHCVVVLTDAATSNQIRVRIPQVVFRKVSFMKYESNSL
ncbi:hypothetical protein Pan153_52950 [Gimesia panareensis]|uniref:DUF3375 domain-containing protein n=1 Tax=Gimesia panareensis TaxID=2527978 RepID=A0A518FW91_9PLAN|nr:DUF3375 family protein [Gimesia panareensis]QDV20619.1 hypothetical protein Pan153_52950 [Gimesia panareensis]